MSAMTVDPQRIAVPGDLRLGQWPFPLPVACHQVAREREEELARLLLRTHRRGVRSCKLRRESHCWATLGDVFIVTKNEYYI